MLYEVGDYVNRNGRHRHTQYIISNSEILGYTPEQRKNHRRYRALPWQVAADAGRWAAERLPADGAGTHCQSFDAAAPGAGDESEPQPRC